jgi:hypothetical protein
VLTALTVTQDVNGVSPPILVSTNLNT